MHLHWTLIKYLPFGIKFFVIKKQWSLLLKKYETVQGKYQLFLFQSSYQCLISVLRNIDFLNQLWSCYSSFTFKLNLLHMIIRYFMGINPSSLSQVSSLWEKNYSYRIAWETSIHGTHGYFSSSENVAINLSCQRFTFSFEEYVSPFHLHEKLFSIKIIV
jgi:hypothetical protein